MGEHDSTKTPPELTGNREQDAEKYVEYLAAHGLRDDQCQQLQKLIDDGRAAEVKAHLSSWVKRGARDVLTGKKPSNNDVNVEELAYRIVEDVALLQITYDAGVTTVLRELSDEKLKALVEYFAEVKVGTSRHPIRQTVKHAAKVELVLRWQFKKAQRAIAQGATSYCIHHQCDAAECIKKH